MSTRSPYIVGPVYDWAFFLAPPALALWLGIMISGTAFADAPLAVAGAETTAAGILIGTIIHAHLVAVFFRSHANTGIFRLYPYRFVAVPIILWVAIVSSTWLAITAAVVATFWDVWHSGAQTFGFARIYERNAGTPPEQGRRLDLWINQLLYAGPILAGATLMDHVGVLGDYESVGATFFSSIPAEVEGARSVLFWAVIAAGTLFIAYYLYAYWRMYRQGYRFSFFKVYLVASTGFCSIYTWGFNSWGEAFFIMNLFHAVQYLALVWAMEGKRVAQRFRLKAPVALVAFLGSVLAYGVGVQLVDPGIDTIWAVTIVVSLMHFWYDGFVWSVRAKQI